MDATGYSIGGFSAVNMFLVLLGVVYSLMLAWYTTKWSQENSDEELTGGGIFELAVGLGVVFGAAGATLLLTYNFLWTAVALVVTGVPVLTWLYAVDKRERQTVAKSR